MDMRIVSFLPSATEMVYALGLGNRLVGVTHECDYPEEAKNKPVVVRSAIETKGLTSQQIDEAVSRTLKAGQSLYTVDETLLKEMAPDLILTQDLCQVCAPSGNEIGRVLKFLPISPKIVWLTPRCLEDIFINIRQVGEATGRLDRADEMVRQLRKRVEAVADRARHLSSQPRVFCMEWLSPPYNAGHWMPELVELAGGRDGLAKNGRDSIRISWERILDYAPEVLIMCPCGFHLEEAVRQARLLTRYPDWKLLPAVQHGRVYVMDASSYFARPGPRIVDGLELMAAVIHPKAFSWSGPASACRRLTLEELNHANHESLHADRRSGEDEPGRRTEDLEGPPSDRDLRDGG
jgi:iron complex transport system substrate-binding protein